MHKDEESMIDTFLKQPEYLRFLIFGIDDSIEKVPIPDSEFKFYIRYCLGILLLGVFHDDKPIGMCFFKIQNCQNVKVCRVEYAVIEEYRHQGLCKQMVYLGLFKTIIWGMKSGITMDLFEADIEPDNFASIKLAKSLNMKFKKSYKYKGVDFHVYSLGLIDLNKKISA